MKVKLPTSLTAPTGTKTFSYLLCLGTITVISLGSFYFWKNRYSSSAYSPSGSVYAVELPKEIKKEDLANLTQEQKEILDRQIFQVVETRLKSKLMTKEITETQSVVVVLTDHGQPILPDLNLAPQEQSPPSAPPPTVTAAPAREEPAPTLPPCADTDGGKDYFTKGTLTTSYGDVKVDYCSNDNIVGEYSCSPGKILVFDGFICPGNCLDGACQEVISPTATVTPMAQATVTKAPVSPTVTPTPTNVPCFDSDGGKNIYTKGSVTSWGKTHFDTCYSLHDVGDLDHCSDYFCRLLEMSCQPQGFQGEPFICEHGCLDGACLKTAPTATPIPTLIPTLTPTLAPTATPIPAENELTFVYQGDIKKKYRDATQREIEDDFQKIYQSMKNVFGHPFRRNTVKVRTTGQSVSFYSTSTNELAIPPQYLSDSFKIVNQLVYAFWDDFITTLPPNWASGIRDVVAKEVWINIFNPEAKSEPRVNYPFFEIIANSPAWASKDGQYWGTFDEADPASLLMTTFYKLYFEDNQFFAKFNQQIYQLSLDNNLKYQLADNAALVKPTVEKRSFADWFAEQYILHLETVPGKYAIPYLEVKNSGISMTVKAIESLSNGNKKEKQSGGVSVGYYDLDGDELYLYGVAQYHPGSQSLGQMITHEIVGDFPADFTGAVEIKMNITNFDTVYFYYPYEDGKPLIPGDLGVFGTINQTQGEVKHYTPGVYIYFGYVKDGVFDAGWIEAARQQITTEVSFFGPDQSDWPINEPGAGARWITKDAGDYYVNLRIPETRSTRSGSPEQAPPPPDSDPVDFICDTTNWHNYYTANFELEAKYPSGWNTQEIYSYDTIDQTRISFVSTTRPASLLDPTQPNSFFDIIASKTDLKTHEDYSRWFENNTGNQVKSETQILGRLAEQYLDETDASAGAHRNLRYYFEEDGDYFLISLSYYITPDIKVANEQIADCFLKTIELMEPEPTPEGGMYKCFQGMYLTFEEKKQYPYSLPPGRCDNWDDKQVVCGYTRAVYDNNEMKDVHQEYPDACQFCADFDQSGRKGLRGTTFYNLGYKKGPCTD